MTPPGMESLIDELRSVLDGEIELLVAKRSQLVKLSKAMVDRDDDTTESLLAEIEQTEVVQASVDKRLRAIRKSLAGVFSCEVRELKLSSLIARLPDKQAAAVEHRRQLIVDLAEKLRTQHLQTALLVTECAKINRMLLESMLPACETVVTYGAEGTSRWQSETGLVDTEL